MVNIKFSHNYPKLWGQQKAELLDVRVVETKKVLENDTLIEYDTYWNEGFGNAWNIETDEAIPDGYYDLPKDGFLIQLIFLGDKGIPFCTLRRHTPVKFTYYNSLIHKIFDIIMTKE